MLRISNKHRLIMTIVASAALMTSLQVRAQGTSVQGTVTTPRFDLRAEKDVNLAKDQALADEDRMHDAFVASIDDREGLENINNTKQLESLGKNISDAAYREFAKQQQERLVGSPGTELEFAL